MMLFKGNSPLLAYHARLSHSFDSKISHDSHSSYMLRCGNLEGLALYYIVFRQIAT